MRLTFRCLAITCLLAATAQVAGADDGQVAQRLSEQLRSAQQSEELKGFRINVKVENGVVWMKGSVKDKNQREKALDLARRVDGVRLVVNDLRLEGADAAVAPASPVSPASAVGAGATSPQATSASPQMATTADGRSVPVMFVPVPYPANPMAQQRPMAYQRPPQAARAPQRRGPVPVQSPRSANRMVNYTEGATCGPGCMGGGGGYEGGYYGDGSFDGSTYGGDVGYGGMSYGDTPVPEYTGSGGGMGYGQGGVVYDEPQMPGYAWPGYAAHPNYAALQYPKQYSPQAWPYIGPFYPYPQVPLGWRQVSLEWDDGWWWLDFKSK